TSQGAVDRAKRGLALRALHERRANRHAVGVLTEPRQRQEDELFELTEVISHGVANIMHIVHHMPCESTSWPSHFSWPSASMPQHRSSPAASMDGSWTRPMRLCLESRSRWKARF